MWMVLGMVLFFCLSFFSFRFSFCESLDFFRSSLPPLSRFPTSPMLFSSLLKAENGARIQPDGAPRKYNCISKGAWKDCEIAIEEVEYDPTYPKGESTGCLGNPRVFRGDQHAEACGDIQNPAGRRSASAPGGGAVPVHPGRPGPGR